MLNRTRVYLRVRVTRSNGDPLGAADHVFPVNDLFDCFFEKINLTFNETTTIGSSAEYCDLYSYLETMLSYGGDARSTQLTNRHFLLDSPGQINNLKVLPAPNPLPAGDNGKRNEGAIGRYNLMKLSRPIELTGPVNVAFFRTDKYLAPGNKITLTFYENDVKKLLNTAIDNADYKIKIDEFFIQYWRINNSKEFDSLKVGSIERCYFTNREIQMFTLPEGLMEKTLITQNGGPIPAQMYIIQMTAADWAGSWKECAYNFRHFNLQRHGLRINGQDQPNTALEFDWSANNHKSAFAYEYTLDNLGILNKDRGCCLNYESWKTHLFILAHDNSVDRCNSSHLHRSESGQVGVHMKYSVGLEEPTVVFVINTIESFYEHVTSQMPYSIAVV